ncbi:37S ribosomal protein S22 [Steccherinum ochraceum]|uniref:37S ribosomal protein S22 n=1 Tax=Steccherinum ochraceum TaxID=92696 RepID=A0A4R0RQS3_9APHY|nr:37S ribosomal protein S22 [Steccherinum ochraceum]
MGVYRWKLIKSRSSLAHSFMLRTVSAGSTRAVAARIAHRHSFHSTTRTASHQPNSPLELDPSLQALLHDVDLSVLKHKSRYTILNSTLPPGPRELEVFPTDPDAQDDYLSAADLDLHDEVPDTKEKRKSPAAVFGEKRYGAIVLPLELQNTITRLISSSDKSMLRTDAKRLFSHEDTAGGDAEWDASYNVRYKSRQAASRHEARDVLGHVKHRLGTSWKVEHVLDWGAGTGSALWASLHSFQEPHISSEQDFGEDEIRTANSSVASYIGIDKRDGLVSIGKKLTADVDLGSTTVSWNKTFHSAEKPVRSAGEIVAISAFTMSALPTPLKRKAMVKEMWESGAETIILIDHGTNAGFSNIAEAREFLLKQGRKDTDNSDVSTEAGCHVIAPCPHDGACPIYFSGSTKVNCSFSQRLQRPEFLRRTKHSGVGHEDVGYSYVVIRRGPRPTPTETQAGRVGEVGLREQAKAMRATSAVTELVIDGEHLAEHRIEEEEDVGSTTSELSLSEPRMSPSELDAVLRAEAYSWPRLVFPPLKRAGHIILDGCTHEGKIMRMTIPKSQGKQPFYDARKSEWGDIFPHAPKNSPQMRFEAQKTQMTRGAHRQKKEPRTFEARLNSDLEKERGKIRQERKHARMERDGL